MADHRDPRRNWPNDDAEPDWRPDDGRPGPDTDAPPPRPPTIRATPFAWIDPAAIPRREWLLGRHLIRRFISATISPGGVGKSSLTIVEGLSLASGRDLIGHTPHGTRRVWLWNGEDPTDELQRRVMATAMHYGLTKADLGGRLFLNSGRDTEIIVARQTREGTMIAAPVVEAVRAAILAHKIDVVVIDPFVSCHAVSENDNGAINAVVTAWAGIAEHCNCAIELVHHARKTGGNEVSVEDARGASSLLAKARAARVLNPMSREEAERAGVDQRRRYFRVDDGKSNLALPATDASTWFKLESVSLPNGGSIGGVDLDGDSVGVVTAWQWPDPTASISVADLRAAQAAVGAGGPWRENIQAREWVGVPIARALKLDPETKADREKVRRLLRVWIETGMFVVVEGRDEKHKPRPFVDVGKLASDHGD